MLSKSFREKLSYTNLPDAFVCTFGRVYRVSQPAKFRNRMADSGAFGWLFGWRSSPVDWAAVTMSTPPTSARGHFEAFDIVVWFVDNPRRVRDPNVTNARAN
ncbi:hypothetical protein PSP6_110013 [Paraburkholderia tropica]|nr:hypothetical protein PSP6_110013 [Paraburkholderia tropica]